MLGCLAASAAFGFFLASPRPSCCCSHIDLVRNTNVALRTKPVPPAHALSHLVYSLTRYSLTRISLKTHQVTFP